MCNAYLFILFLLPFAFICELISVAVTFLVLPLMIFLCYD